MKGMIYFRTFLFLILFLPASFSAQTRSKITGKVVDQATGEPLFGANVIVLNTTLGAATDIEGEFFIINVPVGTYQVQASMIGYNKQLMVDVFVSADRVTSIDFELSTTVIQEEEVIVVADRNVLHKEVSNTQLCFFNFIFFNLWQRSKKSW